MTSPVLPPDDSMTTGTEAEPAPGLLLRVIRDKRVAFLIVGGINTLNGFVLFVFFDLTIGRYVDTAVNRVVGSLVTLALMHVIAVLCAFVLYRRFVFRVRGHVWRDLRRFWMVYLVSITINAVLLPILVELGLDRIVAQVLIMGLTTIVSYVGHNRFSFHRREAR
jgi:putative flippase GtrA